jgi:hypothetical protein
MPPETIEIDSNAQSSTRGENSGATGLQVLIALQLPSPYDIIQIHLPASEIAKPTTLDDPATTAFVDSWMKNIIIKTFRKIDLIIEEHDLYDNIQHLEELKTLIEYPETPKKTFEHFLQFSIRLPSAKHHIELYTSQILQQFTDFYTNPPAD